MAVATWCSITASLKSEERLGSIPTKRPDSGHAKLLIGGH
jgi:hypothetical protein